MGCYLTYSHQPKSRLTWMCMAGKWGDAIVRAENNQAGWQKKQYI